MRFQLITPSDELPISLEEAKLQLQIEDSFVDDDALIMDCIRTATAYVEQSRNTVLLTSIYDLYLDCFDYVITINRYPIQTIDSVKYYDINGTLQTMATTEYSVDTVSDFSRIAFNKTTNFPTLEDNRVNAVVIRFTAGFTSTDNIPYNVKTFIKMMVRELYDKRDLSAKITRFSESLLDFLPFTV